MEYGPLQEVTLLGVPTLAVIEINILVQTLSKVA
jgi:hypothetical protein